MRSLSREKGGVRVDGEGWCQDGGECLSTDRENKNGKHILSSRNILEESVSLEECHVEYINTQTNGVFISTIVPPTSFASTVAIATSLPYGHF